MKYNPFAVYPHRRQPRYRYRRPYGAPMQPLVEGMVTLGSVAIIGGTTVALLGAMQK